MFYHFFSAFADAVGPFNVFRYPSFRMPAAALTALVLTLWLFPRFINLLRRQQHGASNVREDTPEQHQQKRGTPTMGGLFILLAVALATLLWAELTNIYVWVVLAVLLGFGAIGFVDDYRKVAKRDSKGMPGRQKLLWQVLILMILTLVMWSAHAGWLPDTEVPFNSRLTMPFVAVKWFNPDISWFYVPFAFIVIMGTSHAVNLTDGLDGLAIGPTIVSATTFMVLAYAAGLVLTFKLQGGALNPADSAAYLSVSSNDGGSWLHLNIAQYLNIAYVDGTGELAVFCAAVVGAGIGFLWYNAFPATVFMGDVGSLALGGSLGAVAVLTKNEFLSAIIHGVFLAEALSVIAQVLSFKLTGKRIFRMAPIHHHFELKGWPEPKIIVRFWIASIMLALVALVSLKLR